jgi:aspartate aminotransferase-like enzyme
MTILPTTARLLLGPGPSPVSMRVAESLAAPPRSHLDSELVTIMDRIRARRRIGHCGFRNRHVGHGGGRGESG